MKFFLWPCFLLFVFSCKQKEETIQPAFQNITESVYASGKIKSKGQYEVYTSVNGLVKNVFVTDGSLVKKGDVLLTLENDAALLNTENARISANYQSIRANRDKLNEAKVAIDMAAARLQNDSLLLRRQQNLWAKEIGTRNDLDQRELAHKNSSSSYQTAILRYKQLKQQLAFSEKQSGNALQINTTIGDDYLIRAKQDGKVYTISKEPGEIVSPQAPVAIIGDADVFILELQVDEYDIAKIKTGQKVLVTMDSYKEQVFEAVVSKLNPLMNDRTRSVLVEATFTKQPENLLPNLSVEANILISTKLNALTIPRSYLVDDTVVSLKNGEKRKVTTGLKDYRYVEITSGLTVNDIIKNPAE